MPQGFSRATVGRIPSFESLEQRRLLSVPSGFTETVVASGLTRATSMTIAPDGRVFVSQQDGNLRVIKNGKLLDDPFLTVTTHNRGERGLLGIAFDPNFASNRFIYIYYTVVESDGGHHNRVSRFTASSSNPDRAAAGSEKVIMELDPLGSSEWHNGGSLHFGPDGKLWISSGENNVGSKAQQLTNVLGKILRINADGTIPSDNPFYNQTSGIDRSIWAYGLRNPFCFAFQPGTGRLFINDTGEQEWEEINEGVRGANYGWPTTQGPHSDPRFKNPFYAYDHDDGVAITGGAFYNPPVATFPAEYVGDYFFCDYGNGKIRRIDTSSKSVSTFVSNIDELVDVDVAADGSVYYLTRDNTGRLYRAQRNASALPTITQHPASQSAALGQSVTFSVVASGNGPFSYQWQRNGSNISGATSSSFTIGSVSSSDHDDTFRVIVSNAGGSVTSNGAKLTVIDNDAPTAIISSPASGATYKGGTTVNFSGSGWDPETGNLPGSAMTWEVLFHHDAHTHPAVAPFTGSGGSFAIPDTGEVSANVFYRIHLTVRDPAGLTHHTTRDVRPVKVNLSLATNVPGLFLTLDGQPVAAPTTVSAVAGIKRSIGAPAVQAVGGKLYGFAGWSDGGAGVHDVVTPSSNATYTATYAQIPGVNATLRAAADSYVRNGSFTGSNFGNASELLVKQSVNTGNSRETYLRFNLSGIGEIGSAKLRLFGKLSASQSGGLVARAYGASNTSWSETGITWSNRPAAGPALGNITVTGTGGAWYELDVTSYLRQQRLAGASAVSFVLKGLATSDPWISFASDEASAATRPQLAIVHAGSLGLRARADAYVRDGSSNDDLNFGAASQLIVKKSSTGFSRESYLRFDISNLSTIGSAKLRLFGATNPGGGSTAVGVYHSGNVVWGESSITWNNRPATSTSAIATTSISGSTAKWYEWDVTGYLLQERAAGRSFVTLVLKGVALDSEVVTFNSDEAGSNRPQLAIG